MAGAMPEVVVFAETAFAEAELADCVLSVVPVALLASVAPAPVTSATTAARVARKVAAFHRRHLNSLGMLDTPFDRGTWVRARGT
jgi:hypothetical protein